MPFIENPNIGQYTIKSYAPGEIRINETRYQRSVVISATQLSVDWPPQNIGEFRAEHLDAILKFEPEIVLLGTGEQQHFIDPALLTRLIEKHIGFEIMNTAAACRTFDLLAAEGRRVVAGLLIF